MDMDADLELELKISRRQVRVLLLHDFRLDHKAQETCSTMDKDAFFIRTVQHWFNRFKNGNLELDDLPRSRRHQEADRDVLKQLIEEDPGLTTRYLAERLGCVYATVETHLKELGQAWKYDVLGTI